MPWYFLVLAAMGLSVDIFVLSTAYAVRASGASIRTALVATACTGASIAMLFIGAGSTVCFSRFLNWGLPNLSNVFLSLLGVYLFAESLRDRSEQTRDSLGALIFVILLSSLDAAVVGSSFSLSAKSVIPISAALLITAPLASIAGSSLGRWSQAAVGDHAQAYGGMALFSLGVVGGIG